MLYYGITPPKCNTPLEKIQEIAEKLCLRLKGLQVDSLVVYDIQNESDRIDSDRPFPYLETLDGFWYCENYLASLKIPKIIYRAVGKYTKAQLSTFLKKAVGESYKTVFVGAASKNAVSCLSLADAYHLRNTLVYSDSHSISLKLPLGGVVIPERHQSKGLEHKRVLEKINQGCSFFVSQGVYDVNASKNFLSDYYYESLSLKQDMVPIVFTFTPCGSTKTLEFMKWLGIHIPKWMENELHHSNDILQSSIDFCEQNWLELKDFAANKGIPIGCNIESVSIRKAEVEASIELLNRVGKNTMSSN